MMPWSINFDLLAPEHSVRRFDGFLHVPSCCVDLPPCLPALSACLLARLLVCRDDCVGWPVVTSEEFACGRAIQRQKQQIKTSKTTTHHRCTSASSHNIIILTMPLVKIFAKHTMTKPIPLVALQSKLCDIWGTKPNTTKLMLQRVDDWTDESFQEDCYGESIHALASISMCVCLVTMEKGVLLGLCWYNSSRLTLTHPLLLSILRYFAPSTFFVVDIRAKGNVNMTWSRLRFIFTAVPSNAVLSLIHSLTHSLTHSLILTYMHVHRNGRTHPRIRLGGYAASTRCLQGTRFDRQCSVGNIRRTPLLSCATAHRLLTDTKRDVQLTLDPS